MAGGAEVVADRAEVGAAGEGVAQEAGGLGVVAVGGGPGVEAELVLEVGLDGAGVDEAGQALGEGRLLGAGGQPGLALLSGPRPARKELPVTVLGFTKQDPASGAVLSSPRRGSGGLT